ncbi:hypothetical protein LSCM1_00846 [Leishmania martiniquensis]|uniref:Transmembrane protein n=1 Tax=Leishmania martiniquensis TaxID=1580590 RepID=A0A836FPK0_9TRYP|nr:hypothetical protein LSCM1_00846 [Leishmania martiniquensis]
MRKVSRVWATSAAGPTVGNRPAWQALQQPRHRFQGSFRASPSLSSSSPLRLTRSQLVAAAAFPCVQRCSHSLATAVRLQHTAPTGGIAAASTGAATSSGGTSSSTDSLGGDDGVRIDPHRLPSTIPGMTQEELAARIAQYHSQQSKLVREMSAKALAHDVELMRRSLSPSSFAEYMARLEKEQQSAAKEEAKMAAMSPIELHQYRQKKRRQALRYEWYKTFLLLFALTSSSLFLFALLVFFK